MPTSALSAIDNLKQALVIAEKIQKLEVELTEVLNGTLDTSPVIAESTPAKGKRGGKRKMSAAGRARIVAAQKARWAVKKGAAVVTAVETAVESAVKTTTKAVTKAKRNISPEGRAKIVAAVKARWAAKKAAPAKSPVASKKKTKK